MLDRMRVAVISSSDQLNSSYRAMQPAQALGLSGHEVLVKPMDEQDVRVDALRGFDVVHVYRWASKSTQAAMRTLKEHGTAIVWDNDDDLSAYPSKVVESRKAGAMRSQMMLGQVKAMLRLADVVTTPSEHLAAAFRAAGASETRVVENYVATEFIAAAETRGSRGLTIGWTAAQEHLHDLHELKLRDTLRQVLDAHPDVRVASVGIDLGLEHERYDILGWVPFRDLPALVARYDIGLAPIVDEPFNRARSNVKLKEYATLGIPWLASPIGPYVGMGEREGGRLVADDRWREEIERLVASARDRRKLAKRGRRWARGQTIERNAGRWLEVFELAYGRRRRAVA
jgi:glycosyltransferase involved in cell wall biosynthesis